MAFTPDSEDEPAMTYSAATRKNQGGGGPSSRPDLRLAVAPALSSVSVRQEQQHVVGPHLESEMQGVSIDDDERLMELHWRQQEFRDEDLGRGGVAQLPPWIAPDPLLLPTNTAAAFPPPPLDDGDGRRRHRSADPRTHSVFPTTGQQHHRPSNIPGKL